MIFLLCLIGSLCFYVMVVVRKTEKQEEVYASLPVKRERGQHNTPMQEIHFPSLMKNNRFIGVCSVVTTIGGTVMMYYSGLVTPILGAVLGGIFPWILISLYKKNYDQNYREDVKQAVQFASAIFAAGGTIEDWVIEVVPRLKGPLQKEFEQGVRNNRQNIPVTKFLENLMKKTSDPYFQYVLGGLLANYRSTSDLKGFIADVIDDMVNQERFSRIMMQQRKSINQMLIFIIAFPGFMYLLFKETIHQTILLHPVSGVMFLLFVLGLLGFVVLANRITRSNLFT